ncbi:hypothetical protein VNO77_32597 [Canavalia gladiata]|uniref:Uncharacterized protein n=1 Tax=Canavalia gladiata TaxID=3824 RepID=A0AAN9KTK0_CANGL
MEVAVQSPTMDNFDFGGTMNSPYLSAPSSPKRFGEYNYLSAPASPSRLSQFYSEFDYFSSSTIPIEAATNDDEDGDKGFAFYVNGESDKSSRSAEELFHGGKIKPLNESFAEQRRGREKERTSTTTATSSTTTTTTLSSSKSGRRVTRSHSPYRKSSSEYTWQLEEQQEQPRRQSTLSSNNVGASISSNSSKSSRRWSLKDFLLFRSASEGRGSSKDPLKKYYKKGEEVKGSSFRSSDSNGSRRRGQVSAHEFHYAIKRAESEDLKKRTYLPYKQGILGRLAGFGF